jgi:voltage-gated potassium channel
VTDEARLITTVLVTPARIVFLILLVGTTVELLAERSRQAYRRSRWRRNLNEHVIICGYGTKGTSAVRTLIDKGVPREQIVVLDESADARARATRASSTPRRPSSPRCARRRTCTCSTRAALAR